MYKFIKNISLSVLVGFSIISLANEVVEVNMENVLVVGRDNQQLSATSQDNIDQTERQTDKIVNEWKVVSKQVEGLKLYNAQKRIQIQAQLDLMDKLDEQLVQVVVMQRQIPPLAGKMLDTLETFIKLDTPFRAEERRARVDLVRSSMSKPKVTASEQVRQVLEAYNIEAEYGRKIDTYEDKLADGTVVNILVIGRIGMFYQTKDERTSGRWDNETGQWEKLPGSYRKPIRDGIRMAKKLAPIDMLLMPVVKGEV
ncbi:MAG: hypothetical protein CMD46_04300 [Gammaproteobacteria bacterium]|nr:hypothetical protein [Gammaproteobacteria bacterium]|tara:strand:- start:13009 stop:13773 length:765 start_codon:yes stop_codon:yes gene_type:complete